MTKKAERLIHALNEIVDAKKKYPGRFGQIRDIAHALKKEINLTLWEKIRRWWG